MESSDTKGALSLCGLSLKTRWMAPMENMCLVRWREAMELQIKEICALSKQQREVEDPITC